MNLRTAQCCFKPLLQINAFGCLLPAFRARQFQLAACLCMQPALALQFFDEAFGLARC